MELKSVVKGNTVEANLIPSPTNIPAGSFFNQTSSEIVINGAVVFQIKVTSGSISFNTFNSYTNNNFFYLVFVRFRSCVNDNITYVIQVTSKKLAIKDKRFTSDDDGTWHLLVENNETAYDIRNKGFDVVARMEIVQSSSSFGSLIDDAELTDFELRCEDGSVHVHRAVLAAASPVLRRMLSGAWRETTEGNVDVPGTFSATLQYFKNYVYMHLLPDNGLEQLLLLASYYKMLDLEQKCVDKLVRSVTAENAYDMIEFAAKHKMTQLLLAVLECVQSGAVSVTDMRQCLSDGTLNSNWAQLPFFQSSSILYSPLRIKKAKSVRRYKCYAKLCRNATTRSGWTGDSSPC